MSGTAVRLGRLTVLWMLAAALAPVGWISIAAASTVQETTLRPPTLLWKSYPLEQPPSTIDQAQAGPGSLRTQRQPSPAATRQAAQPGSPEVQPLRNLLIVSALIATLVAMAAILLMQSSVPARVGGFRRVRDARKRESARRPSDSVPPRRTHPPPREASQPVADPPAQRTQPAAPEPADDLVEALHPTPPSAPELEPVREQAVERPEWESEQDRTRELPLGREQHQREIELLHEQIEATPPTEPESPGDRALRTFIHEVHAVPEPDSEETTEGGPPPHRRGARQTRASVESCEIRLWRGYVKCQLYAAVRGSDGALALSRYFRLRDNDAPSASAERALADLLVELERGGWTVVLHGPIWYEHRLQRAAVTTQLEG